MTEDTEAKCPCCKGKIDDFPDQDGACDYQCIHCGWSEHVPGSENIAAALTLRKGSELESQPASGPKPQAVGNVDIELLERQAAILGRIVDRGKPTEEERSCLEGLWEFVHTILDGSQAHGHKPCTPTIVVFVEGGAVQGVEGNSPVRVILCDFDFTDGPGTVGGRPCHIGVWDSPEEPSQEFNEILEVAGSEDQDDPAEG